MLREWTLTALSGLAVLLPTVGVVRAALALRKAPPALPPVTWTVMGDLRNVTLKDARDERTEGLLLDGVLIGLGLVCGLVVDLAGIWGWWT
jgi:hypothetical protein